MVIIFEATVEMSNILNKSNNFGGLRMACSELIPEIKSDKNDLIDRFPQILYFFLKIDILSTAESGIDFFKHFI